MLLESVQLLNVLFVVLIHLLYFFLAVQITRQESKDWLVNGKILPFVRPKFSVIKEMTGHVFF